MVYLIVVYDINVNRIDAVRKFLKTYLTWIQNSVFEGEVSESQFAEIKTTVKDLIDEKQDSVIFYKLKSRKLVDKETIGTSKGEVMNII